jgi:hypothetical protein
MARSTGITSERCSVCQSPDRLTIDHSLAAGATFTATAKRFGLGDESVRRHFANHVSKAFVTAVKASAFGSEDALRKFVADGQLGDLEHLQALRAILTTRIIAAAETGDDRQLGALIGRAHDNVDMRAKIIGSYAPTRSEVQVSVADDPRVFTLVQAIVGLVKRHPAIREDVTNLVRATFKKDQPAALLDVTPELAHAG